MRKKETVRRQFRAWFIAGGGVLGGAGVFSFGPAAAMVLCGLLLLGLLVFAWAVVFSSRDEPAQRLQKLIKALWR